MKPANLRMLLAAALVLTLAAAWNAPEDDAAAVVTAAPSRAVRPSVALGSERAGLDVLAIRARDGEEDEGPDARLFNSTQWTARAAAPPAPAAAPPVAAEPAAPQLPPLPFKVLGSHQQAGQTVLFLQQNDTNHVVRVGDTIGDTYKVERLEGATLTLRYLPMNQVQTLDIGRTIEEEK